MLKLWGEVRGVMGRGGDKCGAAVLGIGARESGWLANAEPADARRDSRCPWMHDTQSAQHDSRQLKYALWLLLV